MNLVNEYRDLQATAYQKLEVKGAAFQERASCLVDRRHDEVQELRKALVLTGSMAAMNGREELAGKSAHRAFAAEALELPAEVVVASALSPIIEGIDRRHQTVGELRSFFGEEVTRHLTSDTALHTLAETLDELVNLSGRTYSSSDIRSILGSLEYAASLYDNTPRRWSPETKIPLFSHAAEVGLLLLSARQPTETVIAGVLHDALEHYVDQPDASIASEISRLFGRDVVELVSCVTEIPKESGTWWERKLGVLEPMLDHCPRVATVVAGSKISTLTSGLNFYAAADHTWSKGSLAENIELFSLYAGVFQSKGVPPLLQRIFNEELERLKELHSNIT